MLLSVNIKKKVKNVRFFYLCHDLCITMYTEKHKLTITPPTILTSLVLEHIFTASFLGISLDDFIDIREDVWRSND